MVIPLLDAIPIEGRDITADALHTQRKLADYIVDQRKAHYHFTVKANQPTLLGDLALHFRERKQPDFVSFNPPDHGRIETRRIWTTSDAEFIEYLDFPHVRQACLIERETIAKKTGKRSCEIAYVITSRPRDQANAERLLATNRGHWSIENGCHYPIDWNYDEDRSRIRTGHGPVNVTRLRRFAIGLIKTRGAACVATAMRRLNRNTRLLLDYLALTRNAAKPTPP
jgi:predicted transposase YbfD/YdcC